MKIGYIMQEGGPDVRKKPLTGPANHVWQIFRELQQFGYQVRLIVRYDEKIWVSDDLENFKTVPVLRFDQGPIRLLERGVRGIQSRLRLPYANLFESLRFSEACCQELAEFDLIYERMGWMGYGGGFAAQRLGIPLVLEANNGDFITELERLGVAPEGFQRWLAIKLMRRASHQAKHIVATGDGHRERFIEWWQVIANKVSVVENGSEVVNLLKREDLHVFQGAMAEVNKVEVVFVGAFEPWHGLLILIPAMAKAISVIPALHLTIIGSGTLEKEINELIHNFKLEDHITLTGQLNMNQVVDYLAKSDIGVSPYCGWMEFSGLKLFDYKSAGLAVITSGKDGKPATVTHGKTGLIIPPCDEEALSQAIIQLASDAALRQRLGQAARIDAEKLHSWKHTTEQLVQVFNEVLDDNKY